MSVPKWANTSKEEWKDEQQPSGRYNELSKVKLFQKYCTLFWWVLHKPLLCNAGHQHLLRLHLRPRLWLLGGGRLVHQDAVGGSGGGSGHHYGNLHLGYLKRIMVFILDFLMP